MSEQGKTKLKTGAFGVIGVTALGAVMMSPALGIYGNFGPIALTAGNATPFIFLMALFITLPTAVSYAMVSKEIPSSGSAYTWLWETMNPYIGVWIGWLLYGFFIIVVFLQPLLFGLFFNDFMRLLGFDAGYWLFLISVLFSSSLVAFFTYRGVELSGKGSLADLIVQMIIVAALAVTIFISVSGTGHLTFTPFLPSSSSHGLSGISQALIFGILSFTGFNVISNLAEETRNPKKTIPLAIVLSCVIVGVYWVIVSWAYVIAVPIEEVTAAVKSDLIPVVPIAKRYWGAGEIIIILTGMIAGLGVYLATVLGTSRVIFAMARDGSMASSLGKLNTRYQTPWNALHLTFFLTLIFVLAPSAIFGIYNTYMWWAKAVVFFALIVYVFVSIANPLFYYRYRRKQFSIFWNGIIGFVSLIVNIYLLYKAFFVECWKGDWATGKSVVVFAIFWMLVGLFYVIYLYRKSPDLFLKKAGYLDSNDVK
jgi:amino acid transporter